MAELTAEVKEEIREFLSKERRNFFIFGSASTVTVVTLIGGFLTYVLDDIRDRSVVAANEAIASIRSNVFEPEIRKLNEAVNEARSQLSVEQRNLQTLNALVADAQVDIERLASQARTALQELEKAEGSLVFAEKMLEFNAKISRMEMQMSSFGSSPIIGSDTNLPIETPDWFQPSAATPATIDEQVKEEGN